MAKIELKLDMHIAHQLLLGQLVALTKELLDFRSVVLKEVLEGDVQRIRRSEDLDLRDVMHPIMLDGLPAPVADIRNHGNRITGQPQAGPSYERPRS